MKRITVTLPTSLVSEIDGLVERSKGNRSQVILEAAQRYINDLKHETLRQRLIQGYQEMAQLNLTLAEEGLNVGFELRPSGTSEGS